jgi:hypothetical protein
MSRSVAVLSIPTRLPKPDAHARVWTTFGARVEDRRGAMVDLLRRRLRSHEDAVLAGEITYSVWREQAEAPAVRMRQAIARLSRNATTSEGDLLVCRVLSSLLNCGMLWNGKNWTAQAGVGVD